MQSVDLKETSVMYIACTQERVQIVGWRILFLIKQVMYACIQSYK